MRIIDALLSHELSCRGATRGEIEQLVFRNPIEFFNQSGRWTFRP